MKNFIILIFLTLIITFVYSTKLNYPRVLLPVFDKVSINFTLEVLEKGCFKWVTSRLDLIQINPIYDEGFDECSSKVVVTVISKAQRRNTAVVIAENLTSGEVMRCDVILDVIDELVVLTTTRELYLEEAPETFELRASDSLGNAFTTLEGIEFNWQIVSQNHRSFDSKKENNWSQVLRFLSFSESKYHEIPKSVEKFEFLGVKGYMILLEGINTGSAKVTVRLPHPEYSHVPTIEVDIMVLANIILDPMDAHILVGDSITFKVLQLKQGKLQEISLNSQYYLEIENIDYATIEENTATGNKLGRTSVVLRDRNIPSSKNVDDSQTAPSPRATLTITVADKIALNLLPHYNWVTVEGERHEIAIDLFTHDDHKIILGSKYSVKSKFDTKMYYELSKTRNGSRIYGEAVKIGTSQVTGSFEKLNTNAQLEVYKGIDLIPAKVIVPYDPNNPKQQKIQFTASGGDGTFTWSSLNLKLIQIAQNGLAETKFENLKNVLSVDGNLGKYGQIKVAMARNNKISKTADFLFLPPVKLEIVSYNFETPLKDYVKVHVAVYAENDGKLIPFTLCDNLNFDTEFSNQIFNQEINKKDEDSLHPNACRLIYLKAVSLGSSNFKVSYKFLDKILKDEVTLVVFEKLNILNPTTNEIILPVGSSRNIIYYNGPQKVFNIEADLYRKTDFNSKLIDVNEISTQSTEKHVFNVLCKKVGDAALKFDIYNVLGTTNFIPYISKYETKVYCVKPRFINLYTSAVIKESCPMDRKNSLMHVKNSDDNLEIEIEVLDALQRKLSNITSLFVEWDFSQSDGEKNKQVFYSRETQDELIEGIAIPKRSFLKTSVSDVNVNFKVKAVLTKYDQQILDDFSIKPEVPNFGVQKDGTSITPIIENELNFLAVNSTLLPFEKISIYLSKNKPVRVKILQGSGFYELNLNEIGIVSVEFDEVNREIVITPLRIGNVRVDLFDRCLMTEPSHLYVSVVSIGRIDLQTPDRVEKSKSIEAIVKLYDSNENLLTLDSNNLQIYEIHEEIFNPSMLNVKLDHQMNLGLGEVRYTVTGLELGETKLVFNSGHSDQLIVSAPAPIQVFPPLRLFPRNITLVIGSTVQIYSKGGPYPDVNIVYSVKNGDVISMDSSIATALKLGDTKLTGRCVGTNPSTGNQIIFSEDTVHIFVIPLDKIKIKTPLIRIRTGATMPATIWGIPDLSPMILGTLESFKVFWKTDSPDVISIKGVFHDAGIEYLQQDLISVHLTGLTPGKARIYATVKRNGIELTSSVEVSVFKMLELESPKKIISDTIMIPPRSLIQLKSNLDDTYYEVDGESQTNIVKVSVDGLVRSGESTGRSLIIASSSDQSLSVPVEVKNIHYILASLDASSLKLKSVENKIPQGFNVVLKITLHDNLGNEFSHNLEDVSSLKHKLSRKEMVDIRIGLNLTLGLNLLRETSNMLSVSLKDSTGVKYSEDFIKLSVGKSKQIFPSSSIFSVGDLICFDSPLDQSTHWYSSDDSIISIHKLLGTARVLSNKLSKVSVIHGDRISGNLKFDLDIYVSDKIEFTTSSNEIFNGVNYKKHLLIKNHLQFDKKTNLFAKNITKCSNLVEKFKPNFFTCKLYSRNQPNILENYVVSPIFDTETGFYACEISLSTSLAEVTRIVKNNEIILEIEAHLNNGVFDTIKIKLIPAISVTPKSILIEQIQNEEIILSGLDNILQKAEVKSSNPSVLEIISHTKTVDAKHYRMKLLKSPPVDEKIFIIVDSKQTAQKIEIPIYTSAAERGQSTYGTASNQFLNYISNFGLILSAIIVLAATIWVIVFCFPQRQSRVVNDQAIFSPFKNNNTTPNSPYIQTPLGPQRSFQSSPYQENKSSSSGHESPIYGDTSISPQKRINRRYL